MFNKILYDKNAYDRSVASEGFHADILAFGNVQLLLNMYTPLDVMAITGTSTMSATMVIYTPITCDLSGSGDLHNSESIMRQEIKIDVAGSGSMKLEPTIITPISANLESDGYMASTHDYVKVHMESNINGIGVLNSNTVFITPNEFETHGFGDINCSVSLLLPLSITMSGSGDLDLRRIGVLNENTLELIGINLLPGEEVIIDTDTLDVFFGTQRDVSSVTTESVFFELAPGDNEITISTDSSDGEMQVVAIWQNRWL